MKSLRQSCIVLALATCLSGCIVVPQGQTEAPPSYEAAGPGPDIVAEADAPPIAVTEYYFVGGRYYYWHPGLDRYVILRGHPPRGFRVVRRDRLIPRERMEHAVRRPAREPDVRKRPAAAHAPQTKQQPKPVKKETEKTQ